jgi:hypothetical protein
MEETNFIIKSPVAVDAETWKEYALSNDGVYVSSLDSWVFPMVQKQVIQTWIENKTPPQNHKRKLEHIELKDTKKIKHVRHVYDWIYDCFPSYPARWTETQITTMTDNLKKENKHKILISIFGSQDNIYTILHKIKHQSDAPELYDADTKNMDDWGPPEWFHATKALLTYINTYMSTQELENARINFEDLFLKQKSNVIKVQSFKDDLKRYAQKDQLQVLLLKTMGSQWCRDNNLWKWDTQRLRSMIDEQINIKKMWIVDFIHLVQSIMYGRSDKYAQLMKSVLPRIEVGKVIKVEVSVYNQEYIATDTWDAVGMTHTATRPGLVFEALAKITQVTFTQCRLAPDSISLTLMNNYNVPFNYHPLVITSHTEESGEIQLPFYTNIVLKRVYNFFNKWNLNGNLITTTNQNRTVNYDIELYVV